MTQKSVMEIVQIVVGELTPLSSDDRQRVIQASMTVLGEAAIKLPKNDSNEEEADDSDSGHLPARARSWMKQNGLTLDQVHQVFHLVDGGAEVIASEIPGANNREKVRNAYVLVGLARLLSSGEAKFDDKAARDFCDTSGIYDRTNHMKYMKGKEFTGAKDKGWTLTPPGLKQGAMLVTELGAAT
jgi:hypothetical protein